VWNASETSAMADEHKANNSVVSAKRISLAQGYNAEFRGACADLPEVRWTLWAFECNRDLGWGA
jgi:hypothetical protein